MKPSILISQPLCHISLLMGTRATGKDRLTASPHKSCFLGVQSLPGLSSKRAHQKAWMKWKGILRLMSIGTWLPCVMSMLPVEARSGQYYVQLINASQALACGRFAWWTLSSSFQELSREMYQHCKNHTPKLVLINNFITHLHRAQRLMSWSESQTYWQQTA